MYIQYIQGLFQSRLGTADYALVTSSLPYHDSLYTWTVVHMTAAKFKPLIFLSWASPWANRSQSWSHITTDGQSASSSWCSAPFGASDQMLHLSDNYFLYFSCKAPSLTRGRICNLQCNGASSISSYIVTDGLSASSSWCRILISLFDSYFANIISDCAHREDLDTGESDPNLREVRLGDMNWVHLAQGRDQWRTPVNTVMRCWQVLEKNSAARSYSVGLTPLFFCLSLRISHWFVLFFRLKRLCTFYFLLHDPYPSHLTLLHLFNPVISHEGWKVWNTPLRHYIHPSGTF
jgi:hypothetical protein